MTSTAPSPDRPRTNEPGVAAGIGMSPDHHLGRGPPGTANSDFPAPQGTDPTRARAPRVLIVEDELFVAWHLEALAREMQLEVCGLVPDGEGAVERAADFDPDLVLMDIRLGGVIDGIEAARRIREQKNVPIIFITAHSDGATVARIDKAIPGAQVLAKPISTPRLRAAIKAALPGSPAA